MKTGKTGNAARIRALTRIKRESRHCLANGGMPRFLDQVFSPGTWSYDQREQLWIAPDPAYRGPGREYYCINAQGDWFKARFPEREAQ